MSEKTKNPALDKILIALGLKEEPQSEESQVELIETPLEDGTILVYENTEPGTPVILRDAEGNEVQAPPAEYPISETEVLVVSEEGTIVEVKQVEAVEEEAELEEENPKVEETELEEAEEETPSNDFSDILNLDGLSKKVDFTKECVFTIQGLVSNGKLQSVDLVNQSIEQFESAQTELAATKAATDKEIEDLKKANEDLKTKHEETIDELAKTLVSSGIIQAPVDKNVTEKLSKKEHNAKVLKDRIEKKRKELL